MASVPKSINLEPEGGYAIKETLLCACPRVFIMASPQKENGYTPIAHEIIEHLVCVKMSGTEWQYVMCVLRKTYGFQKKEDWITNTQIMKMTGLSKERVSEAKRRLLERKIVTENRNKISLQKDWEMWVELRKSVTKVTEKRNCELRKSVTTIDTITIDNISAEQSSEVLKANQKDMGFNKYADDYEEEVQVDPDFKPEKKQKKAADNIQAVFDLFSNPAKPTWRLRELERVAAQTLFDTYGIDTLKKRLLKIEMLKKQYSDDPFFPIVNTPSTLLDKMESVERYLKI